jgi:hypothetical protein
MRLLLLLHLFRIDTFLATAAAAAANDAAAPPHQPAAVEQQQLSSSLTKEQLIRRLRKLEEDNKALPQCPNGRCPPWPHVMQTPPMMWNGWLPSTRHLIPQFVCSPSDPFGCNNESLYYAAADRLVSSGLRDLGYDTVGVTCHGWQRDPVTKKLRANPITWPRGYKALVDYLHERKLKISAYSDTGEYNCCVFNGTHEPGMLGYEEQDMQQFKDWGVDHISVDNCYNSNGTTDSIAEYTRISEAMQKVYTRPPAAEILPILGIWNVGSGKPWSWAPRLGHYWRSGPDLGTRWEGRNVSSCAPAVQEGASPGNVASVMLNYDLAQAIPSLDSISGPGSFVNLDNLALGLPFGVPHAGDPGCAVVLDLVWIVSKRASRC